ncbi:zinc ribbon domain-containing protein [Variovorax sp. ZT5P49]|uniref:zinc ribbon domain-containing protein n=1 Tax=Variovorax sp. ZT5P49 TaxID=3443733 RepID=UPI003F458988
MALICPVCSTENRDGANFCRSCGVKLSAAGDRIPPPPSPEREWATTAPAQLRAPTIPAPLFDPEEPPPPARASFFSRTPAARQNDEHEQTVFMVHDDGLPHSSAPPVAPPGLESTWAPQHEMKKRSRAKVRQSVSVDRPPRKRVILLWLGLLVVAVAMIVAGWYGYGTRKAPAAEGAAPAVEAPAAPPLPPPTESSPPAAPSAPADPQPVEPAETPPAAEAAPALKPVAKPRKQAPASVQQPSNAPEPAAPVAAPAPPPAPAAPAEPQAMCGDRNFIAKAQCMAAQCLKPEFKAHAQCEAVRRQQRLEEEKRNPSLIN